MNVSAVACREALNMKSEAALVGQAPHQLLRAFIVCIVLLCFPVTAHQHHHVALQPNTS